MLKTLFSAVAVAATFSSAGLAHAHSTETENGLTIEHPWARPSIPGARTSAAYLEIENLGDQDDKLLSATIAGVDHVEIHEMALVEDVMRMSRVEQGLVIPAGEYITLQPGGLHLMLMGLEAQLEDGDSLSGVLTFEHAGEVAVEFKVEPLTKADQMAEMNHDSMASDSMDHGSMNKDDMAQMDHGHDTSGH